MTGIETETVQLRVAASVPARSLGRTVLGGLWLMLWGGRSCFAGILGECTSLKTSVFHWKVWAHVLAHHKGNMWKHLRRNSCIWAWREFQIPTSNSFSAECQEGTTVACLRWLNGEKIRTGSHLQMVEAYRRLIAATATAISILLEISKQLVGLTLARKGFFDVLYKSDNVIYIYLNYQFILFIFVHLCSLIILMQFRQFRVSQALGFAVARAQRS